MKYTCAVGQRSDGRWQARYEGRDLGNVEVTATSRDQAIEKLRGELRYRLELCPCSGESYQHIEIELTEQV